MMHTVIYVAYSPMYTDRGRSLESSSARDVTIYACKNACMDVYIYMHDHACVCAHIYTLIYIYIYAKLSSCVFAHALFACPLVHPVYNYA